MLNATISQQAIADALGDTVNVRSQVLLMQSITSALQHKQHALLESPTGTGQHPAQVGLICKVPV